MDREQLRQKAASRRNHVEESKPLQAVLWPCEFCERDFVQEKSFMNHKCRERDRIEQLRGSIGQAAYAHYADWMKAKKLSVPPIESFGNSKYYNAFVKFAEHAIRTNIPNTKRFIQLMVEHRDVQPILWCRDNVYAMYLQWYDEGHPPEGQVIESLDYLKSLAVDYECELSKTFETIPIDKLVTHIKRRKLSPWFLCSSSVFRKFMTNQTEENKIKLEGAVNMGAMIARIQKDSGLFAFFGRVCEAEGL